MKNIRSGSIPADTNVTMMPSKPCTRLVTLCHRTRHFGDVLEKTLLQQSLEVIVTTSLNISIKHWNKGYCEDV